MPSGILNMQTIRRGAFVWTIVDPNLAAGDWLEDPSRVLNNEPKLLKAPVPGAGTRVVGFNVGERNLVMKEYRGRGWRGVGRAILRGPRALRTLLMALRLEALAVPAIRGVAAGYRPGQPWYSLLVTEHIFCAAPLYDYLKRPERNLRRVVGSAARTFARLHDAGLIHRDAHEANFIVPTNADAEIIMVDLDGVRESGRVTLRQVAKDLNRFRVRLRERISTRNKLRFLAEYCPQRHPPVCARDLAKAFGELAG
jgi:hypothetical protein